MKCHCMVSEQGNYLANTLEQSRRVFPSKKSQLNWTSFPLFNYVVNGVKIQKVDTRRRKERKLISQRYLKRSMFITNFTV